MRTSRNDRANDGVSSGGVQPGEWALHSACWLAWPSAADLWEDDLAAAQSEFTALATAIAGFGETLEILAPSDADEATARARLGHLPARFHRIPFGDIWLRDTAPIFTVDGSGALSANVFRFNGWGGKYRLEHDDRVATLVAAASGVGVKRHDFVLEGGSVESDGEGTVLTSRQCLLNANRSDDGHPLSVATVEARLRSALGAEKVLWVSEGLVNDHTDGHIDTIARYVAPGEVACMSPSGSDDPNRAVLGAIEAELRAMTDARGRALRVHRVPSAGLVRDADGEIMPASHLNFYIANRGVVVPVYGTPFDTAAVEAVRAMFPGREVVGLPAKAILSGGGAFHCITQHQPKSRS